MKHLTPDEIKNHVPLQTGEPDLLAKAVGYTLTLLDDGWEQVTYYGEGLLNSLNQIVKLEWVYVLTNDSIPGICKIGMTTNTVVRRVKEINSATGVIIPWTIFYKHKCANSRSLEKKVHKYLEKRGRRVNQHREGFDISPEDAINVIKKLSIN